MPPESNPLLSQRAPPNPASSKTMVTSSMRVRWATLFAAALNLAVAILGPSLHRLVLRTCGRREKIAVIAASSVAFLRIGLMIGAGMAQGSTAVAIAAGALAEGGGAEDDGCRRVVRTRYKKWLWWTRFGMVIIALQFMMALYVMFIIVKDLSYSGGDIACFLGQDVEDRGWKRILMVSFLVLLWLVVIIQCVMGSDILRWRSYYATHDTAWKAHYREVFDHGIREALCCMGRHKYLSVLEEDEVYSVARLLGDLVAYRASGTGHLEFLAGLALLQRQKRSPKPPCDLVEAPEALLQEAVSFHQFSEAAYTGPLLDIGRNPVLFPCAWLHRQAVLTPWTRSRRPILEGDNWWRGHAAAFIKCVNLPPEALHRGRVIQRKREAAYFIVVLHDLSSVVIAVRGTETPEDLLTDALCRECSLSIDDLDGLINTDQLSLGIKETVLSTFPHYGHSGIVESARELFEQIDGHPIGKDESSSEKPGFLSSLMGNGRECGGYKLIIVGHSLGGAVATFLGIRLHARYPNLHVYAYGPLPCVDSVIAEACSGFVTCIVHNDEFSSRLSINSIHRLRAAAITALSDESAADSAIISKFTRRILYSRDKQETGEIQTSPPTSTQHSPNVVEEDGAHIYQRRHMKYSIRGGAFLCGHTFSCVTPPNYCPSSRVMDVSTIEIGDISENASYDNSDSESTFVNVNFREERHYESESSEDLSTCKGHESSCLMDTSSSPNEVVSVAELPPVFLAGLIVHIVPEEKKASPYWKSWLDENSVGYKAFISNREFFKDIVVSPYMFLDHLPWRCHYALQRVIQTRKYQAQLRSDLMNGEVLV